MQAIPLCEFQRNGPAALRHPDQPAILAGCDGQFVLFPVTGDTRDELMRRIEELRALVLSRKNGVNKDIVA